MARSGPTGRESGLPGIESRYLGHSGFLAAAATRLEALGVPHDGTKGLATALADDAADRALVEQDTLSHVRSVLGASGWSTLDPGAVLDAMCVPAELVLDPFPGAIALLRDLHAAGHRLALVSNTQWRSAARYRDDFAVWDAADLFDAYVTSLDTGFRKPHPAMFLHALDLLGVRPEQAVMVGDSAVKDMAPAKALGLRTVLVAIQDLNVDPTHADAVVHSIAELRDRLLG